VAALAKMYVQGVSTRKVKAITEELRGHSFSATTISAINVKLGGGLAKSTRRRLDEACPDLILDARYERTCARSETGRVAGAQLPTRALDSSVYMESPSMVMMRRRVRARNSCRIIASGKYQTSIEALAGRLPGRFCAPACAPALLILMALYPLRC